MLYIEQDEIVEENVEEQDFPQEVESSTIQKMRDELKAKNAEIKSLKEKASEVDAIKQTLNVLQDKDLINTYGKENLEDAKKLLDAGFDEAKIKSMLNKTDDLKAFDDPSNDEDLNNITGDGMVATEEDKKEQEVKAYADEALKLSQSLK